MSLVIWLCLCWFTGLALAHRERSLQAAAPTEKYSFTADRLDLQRLLPSLSATDIPSVLATLGMLFILVSATPVLLHFQAAPILYSVLLVYTLGLFALARFIQRFLPWIGTMFMLLGLALLPFNFVGLSTLNLVHLSELGLVLLATPLLFFATRWMLHCFGFRTLQLYASGLSLLGVLAAFSYQYEAVLVGKYQGTRAEFEYVLLILPFMLLVPLALELQQQSLRGSLKKGQRWGLQGLLLLFYLSIPAVNNLTAPRFGAVLALLGALCALQALHFALAQESTESRPLDLQAFLFFACASLEAYFHPENLGLVAFLGFPAFWFLSWLHWQNWRQWAYQGISALYLLLGARILMLESQISRDIQSLCCALISVLLIGSAYLLDFRKIGEIPRWWKSGCYALALVVSSGTWLLLSDFDSWSLWSVVALGLTALNYYLFALFHQRNVLSYIATVTLALTVFSAITVSYPLLEFSAYRWIALLVSLSFLGLGYSLQQRFCQPGPAWQTGTHSETQTETLKWRSLFTRDILRPFELQRRYRSPIPYLICEPFYNIALVLTTTAWLFEAQDALFALSCVPVYLATFAIYPSRIWLYFIIFSTSDGLLGLTLEVVPERYHSWPLVFFSLAWMLTGQLLEAFFRARDRVSPLSQTEQQRKLVQPFFQAALFFNIWLLRYFFGDMQQLFTPEGWVLAREEALPMLLTSGLYVLRLRESVSKLWLYPGLMMATLGLFFGLSPWVGVEGRLPLLCALALCCLLCAEGLNRWPVFRQWFEAIREEQAVSWGHSDAQRQKFAAFAKVHLDDFFSPFYSYAMVLAGVCGAISLLLFAPLVSAFNRLHDFGMQGSEDLVYLAQLFAWGLLTLFWRRVYHERESKAGLYLMQMHALAGVLWLGEHWLHRPVGAVYLALVSVLLLWLYVRLRGQAAFPQDFVLSLRFQSYALVVLAVGHALYLPWGESLTLWHGAAIYLALTAYVFLNWLWVYHWSLNYLLAALFAVGSALGAYKLVPLSSFWLVPALWWGVALALEMTHRNAVPVFSWRPLEDLSQWQLQQNVGSLRRHVGRAAQALRLSHLQRSEDAQDDLDLLSHCFAVGAGGLLLLTSAFFVSAQLSGENALLPLHKTPTQFAALSAGPGMLFVAMGIWWRNLQKTQSQTLSLACVASLAVLAAVSTQQLLQVDIALSLFVGGLALLGAARYVETDKAQRHGVQQAFWAWPLRLTALSLLGPALGALGFYSGLNTLFFALILSALVFNLSLSQLATLQWTAPLALWAGVALLFYQGYNSLNAYYFEPALNYAQFCWRLGLSSLCALYLAYCQQQQLAIKGALTLFGANVLFWAGWHPFWGGLAVLLAHILHRYAHRALVLRGSFEIFVHPARQWGLAMPCLLAFPLGIRLLSTLESMRQTQYILNENPDWALYFVCLLGVLLASAGYCGRLDPEVKEANKYPFMALLGFNFSWIFGILPVLQLYLKFSTQVWLHAVLWFAALGLLLWAHLAIHHRAGRNLLYVAGLSLLSSAPVLSAESQAQTVLGFLLSGYGMEWLLLLLLIGGSAFWLKRQMPLVMGLNTLLVTVLALGYELLLRDRWWVHWLLLIAVGLSFVALALIYPRLKSIWEQRWQPLWRVFASWQ